MLSWRQMRGDLVRRGLLVEVGPPVTVPTRGYFLSWPRPLTRDAGFQRLRSWLHSTIVEQV